MAMGAGIFLLLCRVFPQRPISHLFVISMGLGPVVIAWSLLHLMRLMPNQPSAVYIGIIGAMAGLMFIIGWPVRSSILQILLRIRGRVVTLGRMCRNRDYVILIPVVVILMALLAVYFAALYFDLYANDPLEYATIARLIYETGTPSVYPVMNDSPVTDAYLPFAHPLGYPMMMTWAFMLQGTADFDYAIRIISPYYLLMLIMLIWVTMVRYGTWVALFTIMLFVLTPLTGILTAVCHVDPIRVYFVLLAVFTAAWLTHNNRVPTVLLTGLAIAAAMMMHAIGVLVVSIIPIGYFMISQVGYRQRVLTAVSIIVIPLILIGSRYWINFQLFGSPIKNALPVWELPVLDYDQYLQHARMATLPRDRLLYGILRGFTELSMYGFSYWLALLSLVFVLRAKYDAMVKMCMLSVCGFYGILTILYLHESHFTWMNPRYYYTVQPLIVLLAGWGCGQLHHSQRGCHDPV